MGKRMVEWLKSPGFVTQLIIAGIMMALWSSGAVGSSPEAEPSDYPYPPWIISYQGVVDVGGSPHNGTGYFKFAIVDESGGDAGHNLWANDGTSSGEPLAPVSLPVQDGMFNVLLGNTGLSGMTMPVTESLFMNHRVTYLRVWFSSTGTPGTYQAMEPNQRIASVGYAFYSTYARSSGSTSGDAGSVDGYSAYSTAHANSLIALDGAANLNVPQVNTGRMVDADDDSWSVDPNGNTKLHDVWWTGHLQSMQTTGPYSISSDGAGGLTLPMISHYNSICFLTRTYVIDTDSEDEWAGCEIYTQDGQWVLEAFAQAGNDAVAHCSAWCLRY